MTSLTTTSPPADQAPAVTTQQVERMKHALPPLLGRYPASREERDATISAVEKIAQAAQGKWIAQRVVILLDHYFTTQSHPAAMEGVARDWIEELNTYPEWAIEAACRWWISRENPKRRQKPVPGCISAKAHEEMATIRIARRMVDFYDKYGNSPPAFLQAG